MTSKDDSPLKEKVAVKEQEAVIDSTIPNLEESIQQTNQSSLKRKRTSIQPRWYNQAYLLFLALRQHQTHSLPRNDLIDAAIELDKKFSIDLQLPRVFRGKVSLFFVYSHAKHVFFFFIKKRVFLGSPNLPNISLLE
jgi:hypothetical protein